jgi:hypothetical protein
MDYAEVVGKLDTIVKNVQRDINEAVDTRGLDAVRQEASTDVGEILLPAGAHPEDQAAIEGAAKQVVDGEIRSEYDQRYRELLQPGLNAIRAKYDNIGTNPPKPFAAGARKLLGNPSPALLSRHQELAKLMTDLSRLVRYGNSSDLQTSRVADLGQAHNQNIIRYDAETNAFISPSMPELAEFGTNLKREFDRAPAEVRP